MSDERSLAYVFAVGSGQLAEQALYLARSIETFTSTAEMFAFVTEEERDEIDPAVVDEIGRHSTLLTGSIPIPEYPLSAKLSALVEAGERTDATHLLLLDADTLVVDDIGLHRRTDADLCLKPVDIDASYWAKPRSESDWKRLYDEFGFEFPDGYVRSTVDGRRMRPYWNAGFVLARNEGFPRQWRTLTAELHEQISREAFHADQLALGLLSTRYDVEELGEQYNYPVSHRLTVPADVRVLHYHDYCYLKKIRRPDVRTALQRTEITEKLAEECTGWNVIDSKYGYLNVVKRRLARKLDGAATGSR